MAGPDLTLLTAAIDYESIVAAVVGVAAAAIWVYVAWFGAKAILAAVGSVEFENNAGDVFTKRELDKMWREMGAEEKDEWGFGNKSQFMDLFERR